MALESFGSLVAVRIDNAAKLLHDLMLEKKNNGTFNPSNPGKDIQFTAGEKDIWMVLPSVLGEQPAVEIRIGVG